MKRRHTAALLLALTLVQATPVYAAPTAEQILAQAARYTVKINVITSIGLNQDDGATGHGAGFLIDRQRGWILTNAHVATRSPATLKASFKGANSILATRVHVDPILDAAIIKIDPKLIPEGTPEAELNCSGLPAAGTPVAAFGHPWGLSFIATRGIVSGVPWIYPSENIQSDATINSGNSGGPLIDLDTGKVIGLNSSTYNVHKDANSTPVSLAEPMPHICKIIELLKAGRDASLRLLPVALATEDEDARPRVARLLDKTSALRPGDLIVGINGALGVRNLTDLSTRLRGHAEPITINIERNGKPLNITSSTRAVPDPLKVKAINLSGLIITAPWRLDDYEYNPEGLLVVDYVVVDSDAGISKAGASDVIQTVNGVSYKDLDTLRKDLSSLPSDAMVQIILGGYAREGAYLREYRIVTLPRGALETVNVD
jgi:S1-C subfamily serine protease